VVNRVCRDWRRGRGADELWDYRGENTARQQAYLGNGKQHQQREVRTTGADSRSGKMGPNRSRYRLARVRSHHLGSARLWRWREAAAGDRRVVMRCETAGSYPKTCITSGWGSTGWPDTRKESQRKHLHLGGRNVEAIVMRYHFRRFFRMENLSWDGKI